MLIISFICIALLGVLALLGESTLSLFHGDVELAARATTTSFTLLGGLAFTFAQPSIWRWFAGFLQQINAAGGSQSEETRFILRTDFKTLLGRAGTILTVIFFVASCVLAWLLWNGKA